MTTTKKTLKATFSVPRTKVKNANMALNHIVAAQKSAWIREYAEGVWAEAVKDQHGLVAKEPKQSDLPTYEVSEDTQKVLDHLEELDADLKTNDSERLYLLGLQPTYKEWKATLRAAKKDATRKLEVLDLEEKIADYDLRSAAQKAGVKRLRATKASVKRLSGKEVAKELRKIEGAKRRSYISHKLALNSNEQLFQTCAVLIRVSNITAHEFDAANFYPTVKPILDGATDSALVWPDDNNSVITGGILFLQGSQKSKTDYIFEIEIVEEWPWKDYMLAPAA